MENLTGYDNAIAIIGMAGQFPQSASLAAFWENISCAKELITFFSKEELFQVGEVAQDVLNHSGYIRAKGVLEDACCFDAEFFGYSAREAELLDPQQRKLLEWSWEALETAGYDPDQYNGLIGAFMSSSLSSYFYFNLYPYLYGSFGRLQDEMLMVMGNDKDFLATRISYKMNLKGPSKSIQTACSSSLVAVHDACQSLLNYECDIALAGAVSITFPQKCGYMYTKEGINSPDGHCRAFDHLAEGTLIGNGGGVVVLKRLKDAIHDNDTIDAVIRGSFVNNDGSEKIGYTAPSIKGQAEAIVGAHLAANVDPETISYIECHGTGTILGDPIEVAALTSAFRLHTHKKQFCAIGSVKTNIGHLDAAAGIAGLIKTALALKHNKLPPSLHFEKANSQIAFEDTPFFVNTQLLPWTHFQSPLRAGVSSFGIGGTNAHVILEEAPVSNSSFFEAHSYILPFSAKTPESLQQLLENFVNVLLELPYELEDISYTLQIGRRAFGCRACFTASSKQEAYFSIKKHLEGVFVPLQGDISLHTLTEKWLKGDRVDWNSLDLFACRKKKRVPLPTHPFQKKKYFVPPKLLVSSSLSRSSEVEAHAPQNYDEPYEKSENVIEAYLVQVWTKVLKMDGIGVEDDFFTLGGDSLIALEVAEEIRDYFRIDVKLQQLFHASTIRKLAILIQDEILAHIDTFSAEDIAELTL